MGKLTSLSLVTAVLVLFVHIASVVESAYPKCQRLDEIEASWVRTSDYPAQSAITDCKEGCRDLWDSTTLAGVRTHGSGGAGVACYCGDVDVSLVDVSGCSYDCEGGLGSCGGEDAVSVYTVCDPGFYSPDCSQNCPPNCPDDVCDVDSGLCLADCPDGFYGDLCNETCPNCVEDTCDVHSGICDGGCDPGWYRPGCKSPCPKNCGLVTCDIDDGTCDGNCTSGWYGAQCDTPCPNCGADRCDRDNGICEGGCDPGWFRPGCNSPCSKNCVQPTCDIDDGACDGGCNPGWYDPRCIEPCPPQCAQVDCNIDDGTCIGGCQVDWYGAHCNVSCSASCEALICGSSNQQMFASSSCSNGFYGSECDIPCPKNCDLNVCNNHDGSCTAGCHEGWHGPQCDRMCHSNCDGPCDQTDGYCDKCKLGYWGYLCDNPCYRYCHDNVCDFATGECSHGCEDGFYGLPFCYHECPEKCDHHGCDDLSGDCSSGCEWGWEGKRCDEDIDECDSDPDICSSRGTECYNIRGSYLCCEAGFDEYTQSCKPKDTVPVWVWPVLVTALIVGLACGFAGGALFQSKRQKRKAATAANAVNESGGLTKEVEATHVDHSCHGDVDMSRAAYVIDNKGFSK